MGNYCLRRAGFSAWYWGASPRDNGLAGPDFLKSLQVSGVLGGGDSHTSAAPKNVHALSASELLSTAQMEEELSSSSVPVNIRGPVHHG